MSCQNCQSCDEDCLCSRRHVASKLDAIEACDTVAEVLDLCEGLEQAWNRTVEGDPIASLMGNLDDAEWISELKSFALNLAADQGDWSVRS